MVKSIKLGLFALLSLSIGVSSAQGLNCPDIVTQALEAVENFCSELGRNQACYGNVQLSAQPQPDVENFVFEEIGDISNLGDILSLELSPMDESTGAWGVALMTVQADIPNTLPGQNVSFILFGDVQIENAASEGQSPMQAFYLQTGIGASDCEEAPESGLLIQTPEGIEEITFNINGVDVSVGSTVLFQTKAISETENAMQVTTLEGSAVLRFDNEEYPAIAGTSLSLPLNEELLPTGRPTLPESYEAEQYENLPLNALPDAIEIAPPFPDLETLHQRLNEGLPICDIEGFPACEDLPTLLRDGSNGRWGIPFEEGQNCILRPLETVNATDLPPVLGAEQPFPFCPPQDRANRPNAPITEPLSLEGDEDGDGIPNVNDACPFVAGSNELQGCAETPPDRDGDGFANGLDLCPYRAGDNRGCPEAPSDRDGDNLPDVLDECPSQAGTIALRGCSDRPVDSDSDGDGIVDSRDACPSVAGIAASGGCPDEDSDRDGFSGARDYCPAAAGPVFGCPDNDEDGLANGDDECPDEFGPVERRGCPAPSDSDGDGIVDVDDQCPNQAGSADYRGCLPPDGDADGVADSQDLCPREIGTAETLGCPARDSDEDGVDDSIDRCPQLYGEGETSGCPLDDDADGVSNSGDKCPTVAGDVNNDGCPAPDTDADGVADSVDRCPTVAGDPNNAGCPARGN